LVTAVITACLIALIATPAANARAPRLSKVDSAQNAAIKKVSKAAAGAGKDAKAAGKSAKSALAAAGVADSKAAAAGAAAGVADSKAVAAAGTASGVLAGIPAILDRLANLTTSLQQVVDGLAALRAGGAAQEYGVVKVQLGTNDVAGAILTSGDIPDDSNAATVSGTVLVPVPNGSTSVPIRLLAGVRSGESDGTGPNDPVAWAGIVTMSVASPVGSTIGGGNVSLPTTAPITSAPNTGAQGAPVYPIPGKAPRVDVVPDPFSFPTNLAIDLTDAATLYNLTGAGVGPFTVTNLTGTTQPITVTFTVRFTDLTPTTAANGTT
jgi:hypothetical protein